MYSIRFRIIVVIHNNTFTLVNLACNEFQHIMEEIRIGNKIIPSDKQMINEGDLLTALNEGMLSGALLDVFQVEPLPVTHPFWEEKRIQLTPHIASVTNPKAAAPQIIENYNRLKTYLPFLNLVNRTRGY